MPQIGFIFDESIGTVDRSRVVHGVELAHAYLMDNLGGLPGAQCVQGVLDPSRPAQGTSQGATAVLFFGSDGWKLPQGTYPSWHLEKVSAHELVHVWQHQFPANGTGPVWLLEGAAEFVAYRAAIQGGVLSEAQARAFNLADATIRPQEGLESYERVVPGQVGLSYGSMSLAVGYLIDDRGVAALRTYWSALATMRWQDSFAMALGRTPDDFYDEFAAKRDAGYP